MHSKPSLLRALHVHSMLFACNLRADSLQQVYHVFLPRLKRVNFQAWKCSGGTELLCPSKR